MKLKTLVLTVGALAAISAAVFFLDRPDATPAGADPRVGQPLAKPATFEPAAKLRLSDQGKTVELAQVDGQWRVASYHDLPADTTKLSRLVSDLTSATIRRGVGSSAESTARLGFADTKIAFSDAAGKDVWSVTLGKTAEGGGRFLRFGDEPKAYLATLNAWLDPEPKNWADTRLLELAADTVASVEIGFPGAPAVVVAREKKEDPWKVVTGAPESAAAHPLKTERITSLLGSLGSLRFSDTSAPDAPEAVAAKAHARTIVLKTFDGKTVTAVLGRKPEQKILKDPAPAADSTTGAAATGPLALGNPLDLTQPATAGPAAATEPLMETVPAGPVFAFITHSEASAPINALTAKRAPQIYDYTFTSLPAAPEDLFEAPPAPPAPADDSGSAPTTEATPATAGGITVTTPAVGVDNGQIVTVPATPPAP